MCIRDRFDQFAECVGSLLRSLGARVLPALEPLLATYVAPMLSPERSPGERRVRSISHWSPYDRDGVVNADP
jgi:hypothetical protein